MESGYQIESRPKLGYRLLGSPDLLFPHELESLKSSLVGRRIEHRERADSTQRVAKQLALEGAEEGTVVVAEVQTAGKGRRGRRWFSPPGGIYLSIILRPQLEPPRVPLLTLLGGVAVAKALRRGCGLKPKLKWPNDVLLGGKKVGGVLTEVCAEAEVINHCVLGVGVNANFGVSQLPRSIRETSTTLLEELGRPVQRLRLAREVLEQVDRLYKGIRKPNKILEEWRSLDCTRGAWVRVDGAQGVFEGRALGINSNGALIVRLPSGDVKKILAGDVSIKLKGS